MKTLDVFIWLILFFFAATFLFFWLLLPMMINMYAHLHIIDELKLVRDWTFFMLQVPVQMI
jgi:hypothetical protein